MSETLLWLLLCLRHCFDCCNVWDTALIVVMSETGSSGPRFRQQSQTAWETSPDPSEIGKVSLGYWLLELRLRITVNNISVMSGLLPEWRREKKEWNILNGLNPHQYVTQEKHISTCQQAKQGCTYRAETLLSAVRYEQLNASTPVSEEPSCVGMYFCVLHESDPVKSQSV